MSTMTASTMATPMYEWKTLPWKRIGRMVFKLQKRIYQASRRGEVRNMHRLQRLLNNSWSARCMAVRKVTQDNKGKKTAGIDGVKSLTPKQRMKAVSQINLSQKARPVRRTWIPKPGKQEKRPIDIPILSERILQALLKLALEPEWEARFEPNSHGFRPGRSTQDAIAAIFIALTTKPKSILDADIKQCFSRINHQKLLDKLQTSPTMRRCIKGWLKAGIMDNGELFPNKEGVSQGSVISPLLANVALHGLEQHLASSFPKRIKVGNKTIQWSPIIIRYADDLVIMHCDLKALERAKELTSLWLKEIGLELSPEKTTITHSLEECEGNVGFDFLGFNIRQFRSSRPKGYKTIIKPSQKAIKHHNRKIGDILRKRSHLCQEAIIKILNPIIIGWSNYYSKVVSKRIFSKLDHLTWEKLKSWARKKNPKTGWCKTMRKYWHDGWKFKTPEGLELKRHDSTPIRRHVKVKGTKSPFDGDSIYWATRMGKDPTIPKWKAQMLKKQKGKCSWCEAYFKYGDLLEIDHVIPLHQGGKHKRSNLQLLHKHCHDVKTALDKTKAK